MGFDDNAPLATLAVLSVIAVIAGIVLSVSDGSAFGPVLLMVGGFGLVMTLAASAVVVGLRKTRN